MARRQSGSLRRKTADFPGVSQRNYRSKNSNATCPGGALGFAKYCFDLELDSSADGDSADGDGTGFNCALGEILGQFAMPFPGLGGHCTVRSGSFFCRTAQIETLVRLHPSHSPQPSLGAQQTARKK